MTQEGIRLKQEHKVEAWNWPHLGALALLPAYAAAAGAAGWSAFTTMAVHLAVTLLWFGMAEHWWPYRPDWRPNAAARRRDTIFFGANAVADGLGERAAHGAVLLLLLHAGAAGPAASLPLALSVPAAVLLSELAGYVLHRASHWGGWLWRVHSVHHRPGELNVTNNLTTHPLNVLMLAAAKALPLWLLGFEPQAMLLAGLFQQLQSFATHANVRGRMGWLNYLIGTAELHRRHHSARVDEALNFSTAVPLWDQLFGTFRYRSTPVPQAVGVADAAAYPHAEDWRALLRFPLQRAARR